MKWNEVVLKKILILLAVFSSTFDIQSALASDKTLSRSCLKSNPVMAGETDPKLIEIYEGYCDKKNADKKYSYLAMAAQRFQQLEQNFKALQLISELESLNLKGNIITDVKFLASANLANEALTNMRTTESRYLISDVTYPIAKQLSENIVSTKSNSILQMESPAQSARQTAVKIRPKSSVIKIKPSKQNVNKALATTSKSGGASPVKSAPSNAGSGSPFDFTKK